MENRTDCCGTAAQTYAYHPLNGDDIRLIDLMPGSYEDDIHLRMIHTHLTTQSVTRRLTRRDLEATLPTGWRVFQTPERRWFFWNEVEDGDITYRHPKAKQRKQFRLAARTEDRSAEFEALSYTWGHSAQQHIAYVKDGAPDNVKSEDAQVLHIGDNLNAAMRQLRSAKASRRLWVDAICINQSDLDERSAQVLRMSHIYGLARRVVAWIGDASEDSKSALAMLLHLGNQIEISDDGWMSPSIRSQEPVWHNDVCRLPSTATQWTALENLFSRPWFTRLWVVQEIALANGSAVIACGADQIPWCTFRRAIIALDRQFGVPAGLSYRLANKTAIARCLHALPLFDVMFIARQHTCLDPRDKLHGIAGFLGPRLCSRMRPSYSMMFESLYKDIILQNSIITQRLDLLAQCFFEGEHSAMPSWVPDWRAFPKVFRAAETGYQSAGSSPAKIKCVSDDVLEVTGIVNGEVVSVFETADSEPESLSAKIDELKPEGLYTRKYATGESLIDAWAKTLALNQLGDRFPNTWCSGLEEWKKHIVLVLEHEDGPNGPDLEYLSRINNVIRDTWTDMRYFVTGSGHFGFGPMNMRTADRVCVLLGLSTPLVVRPAGKGFFHVIGWCYVHGLMDSEAILGPLPALWSVQQRYLNRRWTGGFLNVTTNIVQRDDPRLEALPTGWHRVDREITADDPVCVDYFGNSSTGELINYDPRMTADMLERRGVKLRTLRLV